MKVSLLLLSFFGSSFLMAQYTPFPQDSAEWKVTFLHEDHKGFHKKLAAYSYSEKDSLNGQEYLVVNSTDYSSAFIYLREDTLAKKIYFHISPFMGFGNFKDSTDHLLYDFSATIGDSIKMMHNGGYSIVWYVFNEGTVNISGQSRRFIDVESKNGKVRQEKWIEGIGSDKGLLAPVTSQVGFDLFRFQLSCFTNLVTGFQYEPLQSFFNGDKAFKCSDNVSLREFFGSQEVPLIFPNPTSGKIFLQWPGQPLDVSVVNPTGQEILKKEIESGGTLDLESHPQGVYILRLSKNGQFVASQKIIKN